MEAKYTGPKETKTFHPSADAAQELQKSSTEAGTKAGTSEMQFLRAQILDMQHQLNKFLTEQMAEDTGDDDDVKLVATRGS